MRTPPTAHLTRGPCPEVLSERVRPMLHLASPGTACASRPCQMVTWAGDSRTRPAPPSLPSPQMTLAPRMIGVSMLGRYYRLMVGKWSCFRERAADPARFQVLALLVLGRRLLIHTGSTVPAIAQDGPSSERGRGKHPDELLQSSGAALRSSVCRCRQVTTRKSRCFQSLSRAGDS